MTSAHVGKWSTAILIRIVARTGRQCVASISLSSRGSEHEKGEEDR